MPKDKQEFGKSRKARGKLKIGERQLVVIHSRSYKGIGFDKFIHKSRLKKIVNVLKDLKLEKEGKWADFGCSDGFYFDYLRKRIEELAKWELFGLDHEEALLNLAKERKIPHASFFEFDLNKVDKKYQSLFNLVTCFETLEHTGNYKNAFDNIYLSCKSSGFILLSVPNEIGFPGIIKFIGRKLLRKNAYEDFFKNSSEWNYFLTLLTGKDIETFRELEKEGWGPHLGFNYRNFEKYIFDEYINKGKCSLIKKNISFLSFNIIYILKKHK